MARLIVTRGPNVGDSYVLTKRISTIGRDEACAVRLEREGISRNHAQLCRDEEGWSVTDLGSTNGTIVDDVRSEQADVDDGSIITLGSTRIVFRNQGG